jgi:hypothetical protein
VHETQEAVLIRHEKFLETGEMSSDEEQHEEEEEEEERIVDEEPPSPINQYKMNPLSPPTASSTVTTPRTTQYSIAEVVEETAPIQQPVELTDDPTEWDIDQVCEWLRQNKLESVVPNFALHEITGEILLELDLPSLKELDITAYGKRFSVMQAIKALKDKHAPPPPPPAMSTSTSKTDNSLPVMSPVSTFPRDSTTSTLMSGYHADPHSVHMQQSASGRSTIPGEYPDDSYRSQMQPSIHVNNGEPSSDYSKHTPRTSFQSSTLEREAFRKANAHKEAVVPPRRKPSMISSIFERREQQKNAEEPVREQGRKRYTVKSSTNEQDISEIDHQGWLKKPSGTITVWKRRWFILKDTQLYYTKGPKDPFVKPICNIAGFKIISDPDINPGSFGFRLIRQQRVYSFSCDDYEETRLWIKAMMKATIDRDARAPVVSSCNVATVSLKQARDMKPRPPSSLFKSTRSSFQMFMRTSNSSLENVKEASDRDSHVSGGTSGTFGAVGQFLRRQTSLPVSMRSFGKPPEPEPELERVGSSGGRGRTNTMPATQSKYSASSLQIPEGQRVSAMFRSNGLASDEDVGSISDGGGNSKSKTLALLQGKKKGLRLNVMSRLSRTIENKQNEQEPTKRSKKKVMSADVLMEEEEETPTSQYSSGAESFKLRPPPVQKSVSSISKSSSLRPMSFEDEERKSAVLVAKDDFSPENYVVWLNHVLAPRGIRVHNLQEMADGYVLLRVLETLTSQDNPSIWVWTLQRETGIAERDVMLLFRVCDAVGVNTQQLDPLSIIDKNTSQILTLMFRIRFVFPKSLPPSLLRGSFGNVI